MLIFLSSLYISDKIFEASGWQKILYVFDDPIELSIGQKITIAAKHERNIVWFFLEKIQN